MAATLSGGEAGAILLIVIVRVLATGGQVLAQALLSCADNWLEADSARSHLEQSSQVEVEWQPCCQAVMPSRSCSKPSFVHMQREDKMLEQALVSGADNCLRQTPHARTWNNPRRWRWSRGGVAATLSGEAVAILP